MLTLTCYTNAHIKKNHYLASISTYLKGKESTNVVETQIETSRGFENNAKNFSIRISLTQPNAVNSIDYVRLVDRTAARDIRYYYVTSHTYISQYVYELNLELDVVNTYYVDLTNGSFKNVKMKRRMKDRWRLYNQTYYRIYDKCDEGLGNVATQVEYKQTVTASNCYVVSRNVEDSDSMHVPFAINMNKMYFDNVKRESISTYRCSDTSITIGNIIANATNFTTGYRVLAYSEDINKLITSNIELQGVNNKSVLCNAFAIRGSTNIVWIYLGIFDNNYFQVINSVQLATKGSASGIHALILNKLYGNANFKVEFEAVSYVEDTLLEVGKTYAKTDVINADSSYSSSYHIETVTLPSINSVNRQDSEILAITDIPFAPSYTELLYMGEDVGTITPNFLSNSFSLDLNVSTSEPRHYTKTINKSPIERNMTMESKLYGSYVRDHQICYDTFALPVQPEYYINDGNIQSIYTYVYKPLALSNDLGFKCTSIVEQTLNSNTMTCTRNNNLVIYSNEYLQYIRQGYNYDEKAQSLNRIKSAVNLGTSLLGVGINTQIKSEMGSLGTYGLFQTGVNAANTVVSGIFSNIENDNALAQKRQQLINTSPTLSGSTSIDLFKQINGGNTLKYVTTKPSDEVLKSIYNLFYFYGYADNTTRDSLTLTKTRDYFDYYQGDAEDFVYESESRPVVKQYLIQALSEGITLEYNYNSTWLTEGTLYENWETSI